ncbi:Peptidase family S49 [Rhodovulum sp. ES.010]|uniref:S49 family peptidase n=1 Tax=Rhodovulum sp. ES.010 TaxID=1882821 RepID=UPI00092BA030|nr:S49 family peptidase [Rhodovulum sp. ES.010]SIO36590.1 Peptidase family S49 [Rhodovulum sp. ES.010]
MTTPCTIGALLAGTVAALDERHARGLLAMPVPEAEMPGAVSAGPVEIARGERYAVARGVAVMPVRGILTPNSELLERWMGWATHQGVEAACAELAANDEVAAAVLEFDTPGGLILGGAAAVGAIRALAAAKPVYALVSPLAASMGYHLASQASEIVMTPGSMVGSIGTVRMGVWPVAPDVMGDKWSIFVSSHARAKVPNPETEAGRAEIQRDLDSWEARFHADIAAGRGIEPGALAARLSVTDDPADGGACFDPDEAVARGLADRIETRAAFYDRVFAAHAPQPRREASRGRRALAAAAGAAART